ncbi:leukocyte cysteine proteinase inhibitor 1-like [Epinephelus fuscoguttatus]|uniref:leukocyte cysteine proteinase inhibitor 1-like n=1 Tax=Epinephelus fuscoguttatus TaxID=293821 RepID=UPI0020D08999|nr:leukocyte cysteine proteinase inhibitor 1-like [Epinephelus fuscoguttatus]
MDSVTMAHHHDKLEWSETEDATEETQRICNQVKGQVEKQTGENYGEFKAVKYRENVGKELFLIKVHVGGADYIHLRVIQFIWFLRCVPQKVDILSGVEQHKTKDDPLVPFKI